MKFTTEDLEYVIGKANGLLERLLPLIEDEQIKTLVVDWLLTKKPKYSPVIPRLALKGLSHPDTMARDLVAILSVELHNPQAKFLHLHHLTNSILFELDKRENGRTSID